MRVRNALFGSFTFFLCCASVWPAVFTVNDAEDTSDSLPGDGVAITTSGTTTLRAAFQEANALAGSDTILFSITGTIAPQSALPSLCDVTGGTLVDGEGRILLDGTDWTHNGLEFISPNNIVRGLTIVRWMDGVRGSGEQAFGNRIEGCSIGTDGTTDTTEFYNRYGVRLVAGAHHNIIGGTSPAARNVISGNADFGIMIQDYSTTNIVQGNFIGTDATGTSDVKGFEPTGVHQDGIGLWTGAYDNLIGGPEPAMRNVIGGNDRGISIVEAEHNLIQGNHMGTDATGTKFIMNGQAGIWIVSAPKNIIGGIGPGEGNLISWHYNDSIIILGDESIGNVIQGNIIGLFPNQSQPSVLVRPAAIRIGLHASSNIIGGNTPEAGNVLFGYYGVLISASNGNRVSGNFIGVYRSGNPIPRTGSYGYGVVFRNGSVNNMIGGTEPGGGNIIAGHQNEGVRLEDGTCWNNQIRQNRIYANQGKGIELLGGANKGIQPPILTDTVPVKGTALPNSAVEVFAESDTDSHYIGSTQSDASGEFTLNVDCSQFQFTRVVATVTDEAGNTSEFSQPAKGAVSASWDLYN